MTEQSELTAAVSARAVAPGHASAVLRRFTVIDEVLVASTGVFVVVDRYALRPGTDHQERAVAACADAALAVGELVPHLAHHVHAVLRVFGTTDSVGAARDVLMCSPDRLPDLIGKHAGVLDSETVTEATALLRGRLSGTASVRRVAATPPAPASVGRSRRPVLLPRLLVGCGLWVLLVLGVVILLGRPVRDYPQGPVLCAAAALVVISWLAVRRLIR